MVGIDVSDRVVDRVNVGILPFVEEGLSEALEDVVSSGRLSAGKETPHVNAYIIAVPTPITEELGADLSYIDAACDAIAPVLEGDEVIVLESTSPPGNHRTRGRAHLAR